MKESDERRLGCLSVIGACLAAVAGLVMLFCGCTTTKYVPVETVRTEKECVDRWRTDTVLQGDTRFIFVKGDTVIDWRDRWRDRVTEVHDTCFIERTDTVAVPYPVERELSRWERAKVDWGGWAMFCIGLMIVFWLMKMKKAGL